MSSMSVRVGADLRGSPELSDHALPRHEVFGVAVTAAEPQAVVAQIMAWAAAGRAATVDFMPVHGLMVAARDREHRRRMNAFDIVAPDGQPVRWALNLLHHAALKSRTYGPHTMLHICEAAQRMGLPVYLYGGKPEVLPVLRAQLLERYPDLQIAGAHSPPFRPLTAAEDEQITRQINESGARIVFIGLGCPRQEVFAYEHRTTIQAVQLCVGAAFDMHAGTLPMAPPWMQSRGLEWLYRLTREPGRLWKRYLVTNSQYVAYLLPALLRRAIGERRGGIGS